MPLPLAAWRGADDPIHPATPVTGPCGGRDGAAADQYWPFVVARDIEDRAVRLGVDQLADRCGPLVEEQSVDAAAGEEP
jgi:hypothetical protein